MLTYVIRKFTIADYAAFANINNVTWGETLTAEALRQDDENRDPKCKWQRWVAELDGQVVGLGEHDQLAGRYHPDKYWLRVDVLPDHRRKGIGAALYDTVMAALEPFDPLLVRFALREDMADSIRFLERRGFREDWRSFPSRLAVSAFDPAPYTRIEERLRAEAIEIAKYGELAGDAERDNKLYTLYEETRRDAPMRDAATTWGYSQWAQAFLHGHSANLDGLLVAVRQGEYIGLSALGNAEPGATIEIKWTGVQRRWRSKGIAQALKARGIAYARAQGHPHVETINNSLNRTMLAINERMGFQPQPAWVYYVKYLRKERTAKEFPPAPRSVLESS